MEVVIIFALFVWQYTHFVKGYWYTINTIPLLMWLLFVSVGHDACHFAICRTPWINDICAEFLNFNSTSSYWYHQHIVGHHCFTNICNKDPDVHSAITMRHHKEDKLRPAHRIQHYIFPIYYAIRFPFSFIFHTYALVTQADYRGLFPKVPMDLKTKFFIILRATVIIVFMNILPIIYHGWTWKGFVFAYFPHSLFSLHMGLGTIINHTHPAIDELFSKNYYIHQVITGHSIETPNYLLYLYLGGLNYQLEHHVFPTVNHTHLWRVRPTLRALCKKHNIPYQCSPSLWEAMIGTYEHMKKMSYLTVETEDISKLDPRFIKQKTD